MKVTYDDINAPVVLFTIEGIDGPIPVPRAFLENPIEALRSGAVSLDDGRTEDVHLSWQDGYARMPAWQLLAALFATQTLL